MEKWKAVKGSTKYQISDQGRFRNIGLGLRSDIVDYDWFPYTEEVLISSELRLPAPNRVYRVFVDGDYEIVVGDKALHEKLGLSFKKNYCSLSSIVKRLDDPNIRIERLNKPLF